MIWTTLFVSGRIEIKVDHVVVLVSSSTKITNLNKIGYFNFGCHIVGLV